MKTPLILASATLTSILVSNIQAERVIISEKTITTSEVTRGDLHISKLIRKNTKPTINWDLTVAETLETLIEYGDEPRAKKDLVATVTILGTGVTRGSGSDYESIPTRGHIKIGRGPWIKIHEGNEDSVVAGKVVFQTVVKKNQTIQFMADFLNNGVWQPSRHASSDEVLVLKKGDSIPTNRPANETVDSAEDFLKPHLNPQGKISIGRRDIIYVAELTHTDKTHVHYDLQDLIVHVSFAKVDQ